MDKVTVVNETDSIKITPKTWIDKRIWREINDILKLSGFRLAVKRQAQLLDQASWRVKSPPTRIVAMLL